MWLMLLLNVCKIGTLKKKTFSIVTDNASNMVAAMKLLPYHHMRCFAHTLNIASQKALKIPAASKVLAKIRRTVSFFHKSSIATNVLKEKQVLLNLPEHKLKIDVSTRWNSSYEMIERYLEQQPAAHAAMLSKEIRKSQRDLATFTDTDLSVAEDILCIMRRMEIATVALSEDTGQTISMVNPLYHKLLQDLSPKADDSTVVRDMKRVMLADLQPRYKDDHDFLVTASALDPRFKGLPFVDDLARHQIFSQLAVPASEVAGLVQVKTEPEDAQDGMVAEEPPLPMLQLT